MSHLGSLWGGTPKVTFESLLGHFNSFCASVELGGRPLHNITDICVATGIAMRCRRDARCRHCVGKRLSRTIWSSFNKERMSHLRDSTVAGPTARRDNVLASKCEYPPFRYPPFKCALPKDPAIPKTLRVVHLYCESNSLPR